MIKILIGLITATLLQQSAFGFASDFEGDRSPANACRANDLLVYNMALAQVQASSFRQQKRIYIQTPERVAYHKMQTPQGVSQDVVSLSVFAITQPSSLSPEAFQKRLQSASSNDFVRIYFSVHSAPGQPPCTNLQPLRYEITQGSSLNWLDIPITKNLVKSI